MQTVERSGRIHKLFHEQRQFMFLLHNKYNKLFLKFHSEMFCKLYERKGLYEI